MLRTRAFTLIEVLVVVSIIALLIAILLPVLSSSMTASRNVQCQSNLKQMTVGMLSYAMDHDGYLAARNPDRNYRDASGYPGGANLGFTPEQANKHLNYILGDATLKNGAPAVAYCPNNTNQGKTWSPPGKLHWRQTDYAYWPTFDLSLDGSTRGRWVAQDDDSNPIQTVTMLEGGAADSPLFGDALFEWPTSPHSSDGWHVSSHPKGNTRGGNQYIVESSAGTSNEVREPEGGNQATLDGSVQWHPLAEYEVNGTEIFGSRINVQTWWVKPQ